MHFAINFGIVLALLGTVLNLYKWRRTRDPLDLVSAIGTILILIGLWMLNVPYRSVGVTLLLLSGIVITGWSVARSFIHILRKD
jgi:hypothetical protein